MKNKEKNDINTISGASNSNNNICNKQKLKQRR